MIRPKLYFQRIKAENDHEKRNNYEFTAPQIGTKSHCRYYLRPENDCRCFNGYIRF